MLVHSVSAVGVRLLRPVERVLGSLLDRQYAYLLARARRLQEEAGGSECRVVHFEPVDRVVVLKVDDDDDAALAAEWAAVEGASPRAEDVRRVLEASQAGRIPRRQLAAR